jgi:ubiquinone/menaquinone biosynthesis C-methylase UbiE
MNVNPNDVWKINDRELQAYHRRQYDEMYKSTEFLIDQLKSEWSGERDLSVLDIGTGGGANLYYVAREFPEFSFTGIDINERFIKEATEKHSELGIENTSFKVANFKEIDSEYEYDVIGSSQVLEVMTMDLAHILKEVCFQKAKKAVYFLAMFTDKKLDYEINIHDYIYDKVIPYNIYSIPQLNNLALKYGFHLTNNKEFVINKVLPDVHEGRGTYTRRDEHGKLMMFTDILYMPWRLLYYEL